MRFVAAFVSFGLRLFSRSPLNPDRVDRIDRIYSIAMIDKIDRIDSEDWIRVHFPIRVNSTH